MWTCLLEFIFSQKIPSARENRGVCGATSLPRSRKDDVLLHTSSNIRFARAHAASVARHVAIRLARRNSFAVVASLRGTTCWSQTWVQVEAHATRLVAQDMKASRAAGGVVGLAAAAWAGQVRRSSSEDEAHEVEADARSDDDRQDTRFGKPTVTSAMPQLHFEKRNKRPKTENVRYKS